MNTETMIIIRTETYDPESRKMRWVEHTTTEMELYSAKDPIGLIKTIEEKNRAKLMHESIEALR